jgi:hypothetical protein
LEHEPSDLRTVPVNDDELVTRRGDARKAFARFPDRGALLADRAALVSLEDRVSTERANDAHGD